MIMATISRIACVTCIMALGLVLPGCPQLEPIDDGGGPGATIPAEVQRAFDDSCAFVGCHDSTSLAGGLDLSADASPGIIDGPSAASPLPLVELGNVQGSWLAIKLLPNPPSGAQMPFGGDLEGVDNAIILGWIAGAQLPGGGDAGNESSTTDTPAESTEGSSGGGSEVVLCGLEQVAPMAPSPYDIGTNVDQIPPDIGAALSNNCGCHGVDEVIPEATAQRYQGMLRFFTIAEIQGVYFDIPVRQRMLERLESELSPMPPTYCDPLGDGTTITTADRQLLIDWLNDGAPGSPG
jgi:hypothetical protein